MMTLIDGLIAELSRQRGVSVDIAEVVVGRVVVILGGHGYF